MAIRKVVKTESNEERKGIKAQPVDDLLGRKPTPECSHINTLESATVDKWPVEFMLANPAPESSHWHAHQVQAEIKLALAGYSVKSGWYHPDVAQRLADKPCGLDETGFRLSWVIDLKDFYSRLMLQDIREHLKSVFGDHFVVMPVSELSEDAKAWDFDVEEFNRA